MQGLNERIYKLKMFCMVAAIIVIISIIIIIIIISLVTIVVSLFQVLQKAPSFPTIPAPLPVFLISLTLPLLPFPALPSYGVEPKPGRCSRREGGGSCSSHGIRPHEGSKPLWNGGCLVSHLPACRPGQPRRKETSPLLRVVL